MFDQREELPLLPFGNPIGFVPASRGGVKIESIDIELIYATETSFGYAGCKRMGHDIFHQPWI
ncbi:MAG: hypothetical protein V3U06_03245 [Candidatus Binatia bacterium]